MRHFGFKRRGGRRSRRLIKPVTHIPTSMANSPGTDSVLSVIIVAPDSFADDSLTAFSNDENRDRTVAIGRRIAGNIRVNINIESAAVAGTLEWAFWKIERSTITPVTGGQLPNSAECNTQGLQQAIRQKLPGWVYKFGMIAYTPETTRVATLFLNLSKFKADYIRSGDHVGILFFNRGGSALTKWDVQMMYKTSG